MSEQSIPNLDLEPLLDEESAAEILGVVPGTLSVWRSTGRYDLRYVKIGSLVKYRPSDIRTFIKHRTRTHAE